MSSLLLPRHFYNQPQGAVQIDRSNPLGRDLAEIWIGGGSGNPTEITGTGRVASITGSPLLSPGRLGGSCLSFNGTNQSVSLGAPPFSMDSLPFSISFWFNASILSRDQCIAGYGNGNVSPYYTQAYEIVAANKIRFRRYYGATASITGTTTVTTGWHNLVISIGGQYALGNIYLDGISELSAFDFNITNNRTDAHNLFTLAFPAYGSGNYFAGNVDDIRFYRRALTADDAMSLFKNSLDIFRVSE